MLYAPSNLAPISRMASTSGGCLSAVKAWQIWCMKTSVSVSRARWLLSSARSSVRSFE